MIFFGGGGVAVETGALAEAGPAFDLAAGEAALDVVLAPAARRGAAFKAAAGAPIGGACCSRTVARRGSPTKMGGARATFVWEEELRRIWAE